MSKPNFTQASLGVTDAAEVAVTAQTYCGAVYVFEQATASGWPRGWLFRGTVAGSAQHPMAAGSQMRIPGPFQPGDTVALIELASAGGDSSTFNVQELAQ